MSLIKRGARMEDLKLLLDELKSQSFSRLMNYALSVVQHQKSLVNALVV